MKIVVYDSNPGSRPIDKFLKSAWGIGCFLLKLFGKIDAYKGVGNWKDAKTWILSQPAPVHELQYWGHGSSGTPWLSGVPVRSGQWAELRLKFAPHSTIWFRCCSVFQGKEGKAFAENIASLIGQCVGHTKTVGIFQPGMRVLRANKPAYWSDEEADSTTLPKWMVGTGLQIDDNTVFCLKSTPF